MKVTQYNTNQYGKFISAEVKPAVYAGGVRTLLPAGEAQGFWGFGVAITGSSCYNLNQMEPADRRAFLQAIYGKEGLNLQVGRISIGSSDYSAELYTYADEGPNSFSIERDKEYIIPMLREILAVNPELKLLASPWSPPAWAKTGGSICGGCMRPEYVEDYAAYIVKFVEAYQAEGIPIAALTPQNEPQTDQRGQMPACTWQPDTEAKFVAALRKKLTEAGLSTEIWLYDHNFSGAEQWVDWELSEFADLKDQCNGIGFHYYHGYPEQTLFLKEKYPNLKLHFTEGGPRLYDCYDTDWCKWGGMMSRVLNGGYSSFNGWNLMLDETGGPNVGPFFCGGLVTRNRISGELSYSGQYVALRHFAPFVSPASKIRPLRIESGLCMGYFPQQALPVDGTLVENPDGTAAVMLVNPNEKKAQFQIERDGQWWYLEVLPDTVSTITFE
ncbi:MAG: hypothetical protein IJN82_00630 [Clostridia bacterium]|nr:hypothetical protein [Clostridia bacterium]